MGGPGKISLGKKHGSRVMNDVEKQVVQVFPAEGTANAKALR